MSITDSRRGTRNRLGLEKSPYLLQHARNPVDWYPWGEEAFARAREEDKPVFLSIGYSTCHWCHVMEHESFEDEEVAALLNETFVCVKVDREERPDIDNVYMTVCQAITGSGGWPLTIIMTPGKRPFYAATYIPKESRFGQMGLMELIPRVAEYWREQRHEAVDTAERVVGALRETESRSRGPEPNEETLKQAWGDLVARYDANRGGFGRAPKFPTPHNLNFLLRYWRRTGEEQALEMVEKTLQAMRRGGIYDHLGFGLHRYSTDAHWLVPHFEKMLYDQALLCLAALETYQATGDEQYAQLTRDTLTYVLRDLTSPEGGFYSAEDADSEGVEGKFYVWTEAELRAVLTADLAELVAQTYGVHEEGNFREEATGEATGANILHLTRPTKPEQAEKLEQARQLLFDEREKRVRPALDDKVLTDWNGLMIAAMARAGQVLGDQEYVRAAEQAAGFILDRLRVPDGRLLHRYREGQAALPAYLDDYAFLSWGLLELYELTFEARYLRQAVELTELALADFWDETSGGFYMTGKQHETLLVRQKEVYDGAVPSGNSVCLLNLLRLARLTGRVEFEERAAELQRVFGREVRRSPAAHTLFLWGVDFTAGPAQEVVLAGEEAALGPMVAALRGAFLPNTVILRKTDEVLAVAPFVEPYESPEGGALAYVCQKQTCAAPVATAEELLRLLG